MNYKLRPKPVIPSMPRFAPPGSVLLMVVLDRLGKAMDPAWTGEEILSVPIKELSDTDLEFSAFKTGLREGETRFEADILAELRERYEEEIAPRRRRQAVVTENPAVAARRHPKGDCIWQQRQALRKRPGSCLGSGRSRGGVRYPCPGGIW
jgi:hypothetical protein